MMNKSHALEDTELEPLRQRSSRWFARFGESAPIDEVGFDSLLVSGEGRSKKLYLGNEIGCAPPLSVQRFGCGVIFDGVLFNQRDLQVELGEFIAPPSSNTAEIILGAYERWGQDFLSRLRGPFGLVIWDSERETLFCVRDPLVSYPLFFATRRDELLVSPTVEVLLRQPGVSNVVNRAAMADHLINRYPKLQETLYNDVSRVPPGHVLRVARDCHSLFRYWDPQPDGDVNWLAPDEVKRFDELFDQAVGRCLSVGPAGIFLSGGLDSVSVAAFAVERSRFEGSPKPWALSLIFPNPKENEEVVQRGVAAQLGLPQVLKPFFEATGENGLLGPALALSESLSAPLMNTWLPAYLALAQEGQRRGCRAILTGGGGDEWLTVTPFLAADLLRDHNLVGLYRLWQSMRRSFRRSSLELLRGVVWTFGAKPLIIPPAHHVVKQITPWALTLRHRLSRRPPQWILPKWLAADPILRRELDRRKEEQDANKDKSHSFYMGEGRIALDHPVVSWELEEAFEVFQKVGVRLLQPFWDPDLVDMLYRTPPFQLLQDGRSKGIVRASVSRRLPNLGFERQRKLEATDFYSSLIYQDGGDAWQRLGGAQTLSDLGIIDDQALRPAVQKIMARRERGRDAHQFWSILNLESWARAHVS